MSTPRVNAGFPTAAAPPPEVERAVQRALRIAALLCAVVVLALVAVHELTRHDDPLKSPQLAALKAQLLAEPQNEALKEQIRALDLRLRQRHAWLLAVYRDGAWLLAGAAVALVLLGKLWARWHAELPRPQPRPDAAERYVRATQLARRLAAAVGALALAALGWLSLSARSPVPADPAALEKWLARLQGGATGETAAADLPDPAEYAANWPRFLGPTGNPRVTNLALALKFDLATGAGLRWKTPLAAPGFNSPLIWSNRVFLSGGDASVRRVFAFDLATGRLAWERAVTNVPGSPAVLPEVPESTGFAASTMATDGRRVYALFANGDLAAFTLEGTPVWAKNLGAPQNPYGHATSLVTWRDRLLVQYDQAEPEKNLSRLYALAGATGRVLWQKNRPVGASWATPVVFEAAGKTQIGTLGGDFVIAYHAADGAELWRARLLSGEITPSPQFAGGRFLGISPGDRLFALRPDGAGDVTKTHLVWETDELVPDITSPVSDDAHVFTVLSHGVVACHDLETGKLVWEHELDFEVNASPALVGERLYVFGTKGAVAVLEVGPAARTLARLDLGEGVFASPALAQGVMVVRTVKTLFCVGPDTAPALEAKRP
jgi:outer membrane protein assembly factor BamB